MSALTQLKRDPQWVHRFNPNHTPAWRFERATRSLSDNFDLHPRYDDQDTKLIRAYLQAKHRLRQKHDDIRDFERALGSRFGELWLADQFYSRGAGDRQRYSLEARILAQAPLEEILEFSNLTVGGLDWYERCFFDVRSRLKHRDYIISRVITPVFMSGLAHRSPELICKYFGYFGGPHVLNLMLDGLDRIGNNPEHADEVPGWVEKQIRSSYKAQMMVTVNFVEPGNFTLKPIFEGYQGLAALELREQGDAGEENAINSALLLLSKQTPMPVGDEADRLPATPVAGYAKGQVEPSPHELLEISRGRSPESLKNYSDDWQSPLDQRRAEANADTDYREDSEPDR